MSRKKNTKAKTKVETKEPLKENSLKPIDLQKVSNLLKVTGAKYNTLDTAEYQKSLDRMTLGELHEEALRVGLKPYGERFMTTRTLVDFFNEYRAQHVPTYFSSDVNNAGISKEKQARLNELLRDAR